MQQPLNNELIKCDDEDGDFDNDTATSASWWLFKARWKQTMASDRTPRSSPAIICAIAAAAHDKTVCSQRVHTASEAVVTTGRCDVSQ